MIVTIDGPAGSGKSTAARGLAKRLQFHFLDTGAMYRAAAWSCLQKNVNVHDEQAVVAATAQIAIRFSNGHVLVDGVDVTSVLRTPKVTEASSYVATYEGVRRLMIEQQRAAAGGLNIVSEGRDQGTVVFPGAECKFFLTADPRERALRRQREFQGVKEESSLDEILAQLRDRDQRDANRAFGPLKPADDAVQIDTSNLDQTQVVDHLEQIVRERLR